MAEKKDVREALRKEGINAPESTVLSLTTLLNEICRFNSFFNLVGSKGEKEILTKHILDSAYALPHFLKRTKERSLILDVGSGAGLPGLVLASFMPDRNFVLLDRLPARTSFMESTAALMKLRNVTVVTDDVKNVKEKFDCITMRAFSSLSKAAPLLFPLNKKDTVNIFYKGKEENVKRELVDMVREGYTFISELYSVSALFLDGERTIAIISYWRRK